MTMRKEIRARGKGGIVTLTTVMEAKGPLLEGLRAAEIKQIWQTALFAVAVWWRDNYLVLRFTNYARAKLDYDLKSGHIKRKKRFQATDPLVWTGDLRVAVLQGARIRVSGSASNPKARISWRYPHAYADIIYTVLGQILPQELTGAAVAEFERVAMSLLSGVEVTKRTRSGAVARGGARMGTVSSRLDSSQSGQARSRFKRQAEARELALNDAADFAADKEIRAEEGHAAAQRAVKRTHDRWRRTSGGSAPVGGVATEAQSYRASRRGRHAAAQRKYRSRTRFRRTQGRAR